ESRAEKWQEYHGALAEQKTSMELWPPDHFDLPPFVLGFLHRPHLAKRGIAAFVGGNRSRFEAVDADHAERELGDRAGCSLKNGGAPERRERETPFGAAAAGPGLAPFKK